MVGTNTHTHICPELQVSRQQTTGETTSPLLTMEGGRGMREVGGRGELLVFSIRSLSPQSSRPSWGYSELVAMILFLSLNLTLIQENVWLLLSDPKILSGVCLAAPRSRTPPS